MAERDITMEVIEVDLLSGDNRQAPHLARNPSGQLPTLGLDNGSYLAEVTAICEYLDEVHGGSDLIGTTIEDRATTRMWTRRVDIQIIEPLTNGFRYSEGLALFEPRMITIPQAADQLKAIAQQKISWLDGLLANKDYICGDRFSLADIMLYAFLEFGISVAQPLNEQNKHVIAWYQRVSARASAKA